MYLLLIKTPLIWGRRSLGKRHIQLRLLHVLGWDLVGSTHINEYGGDRRLRTVLELLPAACGAGDGLERLAVGLVVDLHLQVVALHTIFRCGELEGDTYSLAK